MLNNWLHTPNYQLRILPPSIYDLFVKLDEELLIGDNIEALYANELHVSGIFGNFNSINCGSGDYLESWMV